MPLEAANVSALLLTLVMGVTLAVGGLHVWLWPERRDATQGWVILWCAATLLAQGARALHLSGADPDWIPTLARVQSAATFPQCLALAGFGAGLRGRRWSWRRHRTLVGLATTSAGLALFTSLFVLDEVHPMRDWFGRAYLEAHGTAGMFAIVAMMTGTALVVLRSTLRAPLGAREQRVIGLALTGYVACAGFSAVAAMHLMLAPTLFAYAPVLVSVGMSYLLVRRYQRLTTQLETMVDEQTHELRDNEERYRRLVDEAPIAVIACNAAGRVTAANPPALALMGRGSPEAASSRDLRHFAPFVESGLAGLFARVLDGGEAIHRDLSYRTSWGRNVSLRVHLAALRDRDGRVRGAQAFIEDESQRADLERSLRQFRKMQAVGQLAAGIAHEINNPMAYVRANLRMLREELAELESTLHKSGEEDAAERVAEGAELLDDSLEGVERTVNLVHEVKEFSHGSIGDLCAVDVTELLDDALRYATPERGPGVRVERAYAPCPRIEAAPDPLRQVFLNLVVNAFHAVGDEGHVRLSTMPRQGGVAIRIEDDGSGIEAGLRERIFEPFFTTKGSGRGTGLGLYISYEIVRMHGGELSVESVPGEGTVFVAWLPEHPRRPTGSTPTNA